ncbi:YigZ family protein [Paracoccus pacificus]|uniref:YigZ family protein n=1 Tax=Paracoccus pacificus TaxID=1463598 RepID=A0ABW4RBP7_9RHOB
MIRDRGSRYAVSAAPAIDAAEAKAFVRHLCTDRKFARATHHSWALLPTDQQPIADDDGEAGAGAIIAQMLVRAGLYNHVVVVTRWYGGKKLGGDRFRHVRDSVRILLKELGL